MNFGSVIISSLGALALMAGSVSAAPVRVWDGPGPRACMGRCSVDWALSQLSPEQRAAVTQAMDAAPLGFSIPVQDGATFTMMSYFDQTPHADMRTTVATLDGIEPATGWQFDGWSFVKIAGCQNWAVLTDAPPVGSVFAPLSGASPVALASTPISPTTASPAVSEASATTAAISGSSAASTPVSTTTTPSTTSDGSTDDATPVALTSDDTFFSGMMDTPLLDFSGTRSPVDPVLSFDAPEPANPSTKPTTSPTTAPPLAPVPLPPALFLLLLSLVSLGIWRHSTTGKIRQTAL